MGMRQLFLIALVLFSLSASAQNPMFKLIAKKQSAPGCSLLFDTYTAYTGISLRKLRTGQDSCIIVRRSSDNTTQLIGFVGCMIDTNSLKAFVGAGNGFVTDWIDGTGNGLNFTQATTSRQPKIINSGTIYYDGGKPAVYFNGSTYMTAAVALTSNTLYNYSVINNTSGTNNAARILSFWLGTQSDYNNTNGFVVAFNTAAAGMYNYRNNAYVGSLGAYTAGTRYLMYSYLQTSTAGLARNGGTASTGSTSATNINAQYARIGVDGNTLNAVAYLTGYIQETIIFNSNVSASRTGIESNINGYWSIY